MRLILVSLFLVFLASCRFENEFSDYRKVVEYLASVSEVKENDLGIQVVELNFSHTVIAVSTVGLEAKGAVWQAFPASKISTDIIGKHVGRQATIKYRLVRPQTETAPPLIYITEFTLSK